MSCGIPLKTPGICDRCNTQPPTYRMMRSWAVFDSPVQNALHTIKYRRNIGLADMLARQMVEYVRSLELDAQLVIPVPLGKKRLQERGYNQIGLVARPLAYELGLRYAPRALWKIRETRTQVGLSVSERHANVSNAYQADGTVVSGRPVLLMDDVATTGSTVSACTTALLQAGASEVYVLTIARALAHHDMNRV